MKNRAEYLRKYFFETNKHFESRVNEALNVLSSKEDVEVTSIYTDLKYVVLFYTEKVNVIASKKKVTGFVLTSNEI